MMIAYYRLCLALVFLLGCIGGRYGSDPVRPVFRAVGMAICKAGLLSGWQGQGE